MRIAGGSTAISVPAHPTKLIHTPRILFITTIATTIHGFLLPYADDCRSRGWRVDAAAAGTEMIPQLRDHFGSVWELSWDRHLWPIWSHGRAFLQMRRLLLRGRYDIVHVHTPIAALVSRLAVASIRPSSRPLVIYTAHGFHFHHTGRALVNGLYVAMERLGGRWTDFLVTINKEDHEAALRHELAPHGRIRLMPGIGVDTDLYRPRSARTRNGRDHARIIVVGELNRNKRPLDVVRALSISSHKSSELSFVGDGPLAKQVLTVAQALGLADRVRLLGFRSDVSDLVSQSDVLVLASSREGLPRSVLEAMSAEIPVVGTNIRGTRDLLNTGAGLLYEVGDVPALARALDTILTDAELARRLGRAGRQAALATYATEHLIELHRSLYDDALELRALRKKLKPDDSGCICEASEVSRSRPRA